MRILLIVLVGVVFALFRIGWLTTRATGYGLSVPPRLRAFLLGERQR